MTIVPYNSVNAFAQVTPGVLTEIVPPSTSFLTSPSGRTIGIVGTASWGPVNSPVILSSYSDCVAKFGPLVQRKGDLATAIMAAGLQGASNFRAVRVTNASDVAASIAIGTNCLTISGLYTGSLGNSVQVALAKGTAKSTNKLVVSMPGQIQEVFDNITGTGNTLWLNIAAAVNAGQSIQRGPSQIVVATAGVGATSPSGLLGSYTLTGGTDGAAGSMNATYFIGSDATPRTGMYALRNTGCSIGVLVDVDDPTSWTLQDAFGLSEGIYMIANNPAGDTIANVTTVMGTSGVDDYAIKVLFGDWVWFNDTTNNKTRLVSPSAFVAGRMASLKQSESSLNKPIRGIAGTQKSSLNQTYSQAELDAIGLLGLDIITTPSPGGNYYSLRFGQNASSNAAINGDNYTRLTNFLAKSFDSAAGKFIGVLQTPKMRREVRATFTAFLRDLEDAGTIGTADGRRSYSVDNDDSVNSPSQVALGYHQVNIQVTYLSVTRFFVINVQGGQTVTVGSRLA